ncbi:MAG TPA: hypothetical protein VGC16_05910, partial [Rhizomicrobium sp.]
MAHSAIAADLRSLMGVAAKLRRLAHESLRREDRELYLTAAAALEERARHLAAGLPEDRDDTNDHPHRPVDLLV